MLTIPLMILPTLETVGATLGWSVLGILLVYGGVRLFDRLDPIDYRQEVQKGNIAAGIIVAAVIIAMTAIVVAAIVTP